MPSADKLTPDSKFFGLFVGDSGSGKKSAACSFPKPAKYFDFDGRIRGILGHPEAANLKSDMEYENYVPRSATQETVFSKLDKDLEMLLIQIKSRQCPYKTLIISSLTGQALAFLTDAIPLTHSSKGGESKGKRLGALLMAGPEDYGYQKNAMESCLSFLRSLTIPNIIVTAHTVPRYGKKNPNDMFSENIIIGSRLNLTDKISASMPAYFDNIFEFEVEQTDNRAKYFVRYRSSFARTTYLTLPNGRVDITGKNFYETQLKTVMLSQTMEKENDKEFSTKS